MAERRYKYDVVVIGGGLSGLMAAAGAAGAGARTALVAEGAGALELGTGSIDLLGVTPHGGDPVAEPWAAIAALPPDHPYTLLGVENVRAGLDAFRAISAYEGHPDRRNQMIVGPLGALRPTYLAAPGAALPRPGEGVWVVGFRELAEFHPGVVAEGLKQALPSSPVAWAWLNLPGATSSLNPAQAAHLLDAPARRADLVGELLKQRPREFQPNWVIFPAVLGLHRAPALRAELAEALGARVGEVPLLGPSIPGLRLAEQLRHHLARLGVDLYANVRITTADAAGGKVRSVSGASATFEADAFVLATGGFYGTGLTLEERTPREPIFNLPVEADLTAAPQLAPPGGHPFIRAGIRTDSSLRPAGWANLHVCGRMLAGYDPYGEGSGGGVAVASGWLAGTLAGGERS